MTKVLNPFAFKLELRKDGEYWLGNGVPGDTSREKAR